MEIECPKCGNDNNDIDEKLPARACDSAEFECEFCDHVFTIGWYAEAEVRDSRINGGE